MKMIDCQKKEVEMIRGQVPDPSELMMLALSEEDKPVYVSASDYSTICYQLRMKNFSWDEIREWLKDHGIEFSTQSLISAYKRKYKS